MRENSDLRAQRADGRHALHAPVRRGIEEAPAPQQREPHFLRIESRVQSAGVAGRDGAEARLPQLSAIHYRLAAHYEFHALPAHSLGKLRSLALGEIRPQCRELPVRVAAEQIGKRAAPAGPERGHARAGMKAVRVAEKLAEPVLIQPSWRADKVEHLQGMCRLLVETMTPDARKPVRAGQLAPGLHQHVAPVRHRLDRLRVAVERDEQLREVTYRHRTELRHPRIQIWPHTRALRQHLGQPCRLELVTDAVELRRDAAFVAEVVHVGREIAVALARHAAHAVARMAGVAVERRHRVYRALLWRGRGEARAIQHRNPGHQHLAFSLREVKVRRLWCQVFRQTSARRIQRGQRRQSFRRSLRLVAGRAVQLRIPPTTLFRLGFIHDEWRRFRRRLRVPLRAQPLRRNRPARHARPLPFHDELRLVPAAPHKVHL